jgi:uncharacterized repeat protein (TIGR01451 family)
MSDVPDGPPTGAVSQDASSSPSPRLSGPTPTPARRNTNDPYTFQWDDKPAGQPATPSTAGTDRAAAAPAGNSPEVDASGLPMQPLHERMSSFRNSAFGDAATGPAAPGEPAVPPPPALRQPDQPAAAVRPGGVEPAGPLPTLAAPAPPSGPAAERAPAEPQEPPTLLSDDPKGEPRTAVVEPKGSATPKPAPQGGSEPGVLFARKGPILSVETLGPRRIVVGKEAAYEVTIQNSGEVAADDVTVFVGLPTWADIVNSTASAGEARPAPQGRSDPLHWVVGRIEAKGREKLTLKLVPRQSRPFELAVRWDYRPASSQATIEVQEAKLVMSLDGPREVFFNKRQVYKLKLANAGNGAAENVVLTLMPVGTGQTQPVSHKIGTLAAGEQRSIEMELTARQPGSLSINIEAAGDGGARAELSERVLVHRAALAVQVEGPARQYVGTAATYKIRLSNPGDAPAKNVRVVVDLPTGMKYTAASEGAQLVGGSKVQWTFEQLAAREQRDVALRSTLALSGAARLEALSTADDDLTAAAEATTHVEALADLRLDVHDPEGPVPVGEETTYDLRIRNRGTKTAENIEVLAYFSSGVEPTSAEGHPHRVSPGQVVFSPIPSLAPGAEVLLKVHARGVTAGSHIFRGELHCKALGTRLVCEETTHFYPDGSIADPSLRAGEPALSAGSSGRPESGGRDALRTADRRSPPPAPLPPGPSGVPPPPSDDDAPASHGR